MYTRQEINKIVEQIKGVAAPDRVYLFGSYAHGNPKENSDLDICVIKNKVIDKNQELSMIKMRLFDLGIPMDILLFDKEKFKKRQNIVGSVQYEIFHKGIKLYGK